MGEVTINQKACVEQFSFYCLHPLLTEFFVPSLEDVVLKALPTLFPHLVGTTNNTRVEFYKKFQREADEYDRDFVKKCGGDLDTTLIYVRFPSPGLSVLMVLLM